MLAFDPLIWGEPLRYGSIGPLDNPQVGTTAYLSSWSCYETQVLWHARFHYVQRTIITRDGPLFMITWGLAPESKAHQTAQSERHGPPVYPGLQGTLMQGQRRQRRAAMTQILRHMTLYGSL